MQEPNLKLKEIIWEITRKCYNGCDYCGSGCNGDYDIDNSKILEIAKRICEYPPESIDISGGDPLLISFETHRKIVQMFKEKDITCKMIINLKSFNNNKLFILNLYDAIGVSVNTLEDIEYLKNLLKKELNTKITVITNFNKDNFFDFDAIKKIVKDNDLIWQIQYTIYKDINNLSIYKSNNAVKALSDKIFEAQREQVNIVLADNMTSSPCTAGKYSMGILFNGLVIPCLSMLSWTTNTFEKYPNILGELSLEGIWKNNFYEQRFEKFFSCKEHCYNKAIGVNLRKPEELKKSWEEIKEIMTEPIEFDDPRDTPVVLMYGVQIEPTCVYAVVDKDYFNTITTSTRLDEIFKKSKGE